MSALLDQIKAVDDQLHRSVTDVATRVAGVLTTAQNTIASLTQQLADAGQVPQADVDEANAIIAQGQSDIATLGGIAP